MSEWLREDADKGALAPPGLLQDDKTDSITKKTGSIVKKLARLCNYKCNQ